MMKRFATALLVFSVSASAAHAAVVVTDNGLTAPTLGASDTGYTGTTDQRFGWDNEAFTQTFTVANAGTIQSFYLGYNAFENGDTITIDLSVNGNVVQSGIVLDGSDFSGDPASDGNGGPNYWMQFDLSSENVAVNGGQNSFTMAATANTGNSWALAPRYIDDEAIYTGGDATFSNSVNVGDMAFAVTVDPIPEPGSLALLGLGGLLAMRRRRG